MDDYELLWIPTNYYELLRITKNSKEFLRSSLHSSLGSAAVARAPCRFGGASRRSLGVSKLKTRN